MKIVSTVIPTKNRHEFLKNVLESFRAFVEDLEIIVIDDGSSPEQASRNKSISETIPECKYIYFDKSKGAPAARNYGLSISSGEYIWFIDDDDFAPPQAIKDVLKFTGERSSHSLAILLPMNAMYQNIIVEQFVPVEKENTFDIYRDRGHEVTTSGAIFSKKIISEIGGWDEFLVAGQDTDLFLRVSRLTNFTVLKTEPIIQNIGHSQRITRAVIKQQIGKIQFLRKHWKILTLRRRLYYLLTLLFWMPLFLNCGFKVYVHLKISKQT
ncbi:MAG: glycosyltransferase family 2 protein [Oscillatoria princeps RMCB-10]|jgi:glycosyltransferase involved in cell wall biosynthesis|nr:glycosyltransferase family 2 protein [Oscillatoria princeps RMCB-10]